MQKWLSSFHLCSISIHTSGPFLRGSEWSSGSGSPKREVRPPKSDYVFSHQMWESENMIKRAVFVPGTFATIHRRLWTFWTKCDIVFTMIYHIEYTQSQWIAGTIARTSIIVASTMFINFTNFNSNFLIGALKKLDLHF